MRVEHGAGDRMRPDGIYHLVPNLHDALTDARRELVGFRGNKPAASAPPGLYRTGGGLGGTLVRVRPPTGSRGYREVAGARITVVMSGILVAPSHRTPFVCRWT